MNKEQGFLVLLIAVFALLSLLILLPLLEFVILAVIIGYVLHPLNARLEPYFGRRFTPLVTIAIAILVFIIPMAYISWVLYRDLRSLAQDPPALEFSWLQTRIEELIGQEINVDLALQVAGAELLDLLFGDPAGLIFAVLFIAFGITVVVFVVYYLLRDGEAFVAWMVDIAPIDHRVGARLADQIDRTTHGVIIGHLFVALLQGILGGLAFLIVGIPNPAFWAFVMVIMSLLPLIGPFVVWAPWAGYLVMLEQFAGAAFLILWGVLVIGMIDNYARPIVIDRDAHLNPAVILIGVFGGIYAIGLTGLFIGPIVLGVLAASLRVFDEEWEHIGNREPEGPSDLPE